MPNRPESGSGDPMELVTQFRRLLNSQESRIAGKILLVGLSGGVDSNVLLHLLRFTPGLPSFRLRAAHFDHAMRAGSSQDAQWVRGLCSAWEVPFKARRAGEAPTSEDEARDARYQFLLAALREEGPGLLLTGHHADDQAETVLFRVLRGTGLRGLAGIPQVRAPGLFRPLLSFPREALEAYAHLHGIRYREDPSNLDTTVSRNALRLRIIPQLEEGPAPRARESLQRLARLARENEEAWQSLLPELLSRVVEEVEGRISLLRTGFLTMHPGVQARVLRKVMRGLGIHLTESGTRVLLEFTRTGSSGREVSLPGGFHIRREFDRFLFVEGGSLEGDVQLVVRGPAEGRGRAIIGGKIREVQWGPTEPDGCHQSFSAPIGTLEFPLRVRGWVPGDRILLPYGTKKLKKLFLEGRVPLSERARIPLLVDAEGRVLWAAGLRASALTEAPGEQDSFFLGMSDAHQP